MTMKVTITVEDGGSDEQGSGVTATSHTLPPAGAGAVSAGPAPMAPAADAGTTGAMANDAAPPPQMGAGQALSAGPAPSDQ